MKHECMRHFFPSMVLVMVWLVGTSCSSADENSQPPPASDTPGVQVAAAPTDIPSEFQGGAQRFQQLCSRCHGGQGVGTDHGPPLVHKIYEPSHHADHAFFRAAAQGVRAHHWQFGNMPNIPEASESDVQEIVQYVRWLQRQAGIH